MNYFGALALPLFLCLAVACSPVKPKSAITTEPTHLVHTYENAFLVYGLKNKAFALIQFDEAPELPGSVTMVAPTATTIHLRDGAGKNYFYSTTPERDGHQAVLGTATFRGAAANEVFLASTDGAPSINPNADLLKSPCLCRKDGDAFPCDSGGEHAQSAGTTAEETSFCDVRCGRALNACAN